jgi:dienelactone hydrolase
MTSEILPYTEGDDAFDAFLARPGGVGPHPAVLVCHAFGGRDAFAEEKAKKLAELGYIGAAIDLYGVGKRGTDRASSQALMMPLIQDPPLLRRRLAAAFQAMRTLDDVDPDRVGAIGFCFGGMCALLGARMGLPLRGVVSFHGLLKIGEKLDAQVHARLLVLHGQDDPMAPPSDVGAFAEEMKRIKADWQLHAYPGVVHAFTNPVANDPDFGTVYDADADRRSWIEMVRFFEDVFA